MGEKTTQKSLHKHQGIEGERFWFCLGENINLL